MIPLHGELYFDERKWVHWMILLAAAYFGLKFLGVL